MKAIKIDVEKQRIYEVDFKDFNDIQKQIGCDCFTTAFDLPNGDVCYVDDEGLFKENLKYFTFQGAHQPFAGNGLIVGTGREGKSKNAVSMLIEVAEKTEFPS